MATEKRLIDANALIETLEEIAKEDESEYFHLDEITQEIFDSPTVEVVHGRWVWSEENECWVCSNCKMSALNNYRGNSTDSNYCPNCGADMRERKNNEQSR